MNSNVLKLSIGATIGIIMLASVLIPVLSDGARAVTETTIYNTDYYQEYGQYYENETTLVLDGSAATVASEAVVSVNGDTIHMRNGFNRHVIATSDYLTIEMNTSASGNMCYITFIDIDDVFVFEQSVHTGAIVSLQYVPSEQSITLSYLGNTYTIHATYLFAVSTTNQYVYLNNNAQFAAAYVSEELIESKTAGVVYQYTASVSTSGGDINVTLLSDKHGTRLFYDPTQYTGEISVELVLNNIQLVDGTTDLYSSGTPSFVITTDDGEHTVEPTRSWIKYEINGHVSENSITHVLWAIPVIMIVALMIGFIAVNRNRD